MTDGQITYTLIVHSCNWAKPKELRRYKRLHAAIKAAEAELELYGAKSAAIRTQTVGKMDARITHTFGAWQ